MYIRYQIQQAKFEAGVHFVINLHTALKYAIIFSGWLTGDLNNTSPRSETEGHIRYGVFSKRTCHSFTQRLLFWNICMKGR